MLRRDFGGIKGEIGRIAERMAVYSDESGSQQHRFNSICAVSGNYADLQEISSKLREILSCNGLRELKFENVGKDEKYTKCCSHFMEVAIDKITQGKIRIDVIIWDNQDSRHSVPGRDDAANLERMYYHLLRCVVENWKKFQWEFYPDENSKLNYSEIISFLNQTRYYTNSSKPRILQMFEIEKIKFNFTKVEPQNSTDEPLVQLADIFAGLSRFSRENQNLYKQWKAGNQLPLFNSEDPDIVQKFMGRFSLIEKLRSDCRQRGIHISLHTNGYLKTYDRKIRLNFWHYTPQGEYDKAPKK